jgi:cation transport regulator ChaC
MAEPTWIFGYGSLVWRPAFPFTRREPACVVGYVRRFWQGSTDHRGVPGAPGRVVTLSAEADARCWGMAYAVAAEHEERVLATLDHREKGGYARLRVPLYGRDEALVTDSGLVYVATPDNENYLGPAPLSDIAQQVRRAAGPSGDNRNYVLRLADALRELGASDPHVFELAALVRQAPE